MIYTEQLCRHMSLNKVLHYTGLSKTAWYYTKRPRIVLADPLVVKDVKRIAARHSSYGTRRMAVQLALKRGVSINRKRIQLHRRNIQQTALYRGITGQTRVRHIGIDTQIQGITRR